MKDLTQGPIGRHLVEMSIPIAIGMLLQTLYFLVDLYFVSRLGDAAIAGVSAGGNLMFVVFALTQMLGARTRRKRSISSTSRWCSRCCAPPSCSSAALPSRARS